MHRLINIILSFLFLAPGPLLAQDRIDLKLDSSEAEAVLAILAKEAQHQPITNADWQKLFGTEPYVRLKQRENSMHREFTDEDFRKFVLSPELFARHTQLQQTMDSWKQADLRGAAARILPYLPADARVRAAVYPVIKPQSNSFVFERNAIFLYVDPEKSSAEFQNTVAHECHHIGLSDAESSYDKQIESAAPKVKPVLNWIGAFGEGLAVLAAAGSPDVHPLAAYNDDERKRWDSDMKYWDREFAELDQFFSDILRGGFADQETINHVAFSFFGYRGPWYLVGYKMAIVVEKEMGRAALVEGMTDPRKLLLHYNEAAKRVNSKGKEKLPLWSDPVIAAISK
jgi:putative zinc-dependent peptidase DUF5700